MPDLSKLNAFQRVAIEGWPAVTPEFLRHADLESRYDAMLQGKGGQRIARLVERLGGCASAAEASTVIEKLANEAGAEVRKALDEGRDAGNEASVLAAGLRDLSLGMRRVEEPPPMKFG